MTDRKGAGLRPRARDICCGGREGPGQDAGPIVEQVEVMSVITFLLDYLQLYVLVIQSVVEDSGIVLVGQSEAVFIEERGDLSGSQPVTES
jgi:hypothetical protein